MSINVSVIVPVYNVKDYVKECLLSLLNQTLDNIEIIIVDDGSTDGSSQICTDFSNKYMNFHYFYKNNEGLMSAWLYGVRQSKGQYIGFVDSDDFVDKDMYKEMYLLAIERKADIVMCDFSRFDKEHHKNYITDDKLLKDFYFNEEMKYIYEHTFSTISGFNISNERINKLFKREILLNNLKYCRNDIKFHEAKYITPACIISSKSFSFINKPLYHFRIRKSSNSHKYSKDIIKCTKDLYYTQKQMIIDKKVNYLLDRLNCAMYDYVRIILQRYVNADKNLQNEMINELINDNEISNIILQNKNANCSKTEKIIYYAFKFKLPILLNIWLNYRRNQNNNIIPFD